MWRKSQVKRWFEAIVLIVCCSGVCGSAFGGRIIHVDAAFDRAAFCGVANSQNEYAEVTAERQLTSGQRFRGTDTIKVVSKNLECAALAASYWLETDCDKPDWCDGADYNEDSLVNLTDFAMLTDCCIEVIGQNEH